MGLKTSLSNNIPEIYFSGTESGALKMLQGSRATIVNLFSFHGFRGFLDDNKSELFLRLHILDCGHAVTCMHCKSDDNVSSYGRDRCRLPLNAGRALCVAYQALYYLADDSSICLEDLSGEVYTLAQHCLCDDHVESTEAVQDLAERLLVAVQRWQCRRVFMDEPDGPPSTPPEERPGTSRLSQLFLGVSHASPRRRPQYRSRTIDSELEYDSWGLLHERRPQAQGRPTAILGTSSSHPFETSDTDVQTGTPDQSSSAHLSHNQQLKGRAKSAVGKIARNTG